MKTAVRLLLLLLLAWPLHAAAQQSLPDDLVQANSRGVELLKNGQYDQAIELFKETLKNGKKALGVEHSTYAITLNNLAECYRAQGNYSEAIKLNKEALEITKKALGTEHPSYATSLNNLAVCYKAQGNYDQAIKLLKEALSIVKKALGTEHPNYASSLNNLALCYRALGMYNEAIKLNKEALEIRKESLGPAHPDYTMSLCNLAACYDDMGNYDQAIKLDKEALKIRKETLGPAHPDYATSLNDLAVYYDHMGNYTESIKSYKGALTIYEKAFGVKHPFYATTLNNLAVCYHAQGNYVEAIKLYKQALEIRKKTLGTEHPEYAISLYYLAECYSAQGNDADAIKLHKEAMEIRKKALGVEHPSYASSLNGLAGCYFHMGNYTEAIKLDKEALGIYKKAFGDQHHYYALSLNDLASCYGTQGNHAEAIKLHKEALKINKKTLGTENRFYATSLYNLAACYSAQGNYSEAIKLNKEASEIYKKALGAEHPVYASATANLGATYYLKGDFARAAKYALQGIEVRQRNLLNEFPSMTSHARGLYWEKHKHSFQTWLPRVVYRRPTGEAVEALYDKGALLSKGLLLAADVKVRQLLLNSGDSAAIGKLEELQTTRSMLSKLYEKPISERYMSTDSLERIAERQEQELVAMSKAYGDMTRALKTTWRDVQKGLNDNEMAVEFITFPLNDNDSTLTVALTVKKGYKQPRMTTVFEEKQLVKYFNDKGSLNLDEYTRDDVSRLVWGPLAGELQGVERIYFAPSGALHGIALEHMPGVKAELVRVSSTREVALRGERTAGRDAVLYGGLDYNAGSEALMAYNKIHNYGNRGGTEWDPSLPDSLALRSDAVSQLRYSLREVEQVDSILKTRGVESTLHKLHEGTEESFKALSGRAPATLLLSTHGKYVPPTEAERKRNTRSHSFLMMGDNAPHAAEDRTLSRSYLVLSGGNRVFLLGSVPEGDDGILTAREIARLDLRGTRLAVLGACETALGDVSGEGVFGLQRGFKKTGVGTILMTLWPINDASAAYLTSRFFHHLESDTTARKALSRAQDDVRAHPEWNHPHHWAGYILLDALQ